MTIAPITLGDTQSRAKINAAIEKANLVDQKVDAGDLAPVAAIAAVARDAAPPSFDRPGDGLRAFTFVSSVAQLGGEADALPPVPGSKKAFNAGGGVVRIVGAGILAAREAEPVTLGRVREVRGIVRRAANPSDPGGDTVRVAVLWLDQAKNPLPGPQVAVLQDFAGLTTGAGRQSAIARIASAPSDGVDIVAPAGAVYYRRFVYNYGLDGVTDVEVLAGEDITGLAIPPAVTTDLEADVAALKSVEAGDRLDAVEAAVQNPNSLTFPTLSDAQASSPAGTVTTILLRGGTLAGDADGYLAERVATIAGGEVGFTTANGAKFRRVDQTIIDRDVRTNTRMGNRRDSLPDVRDWNAQGEVVGGNAATFSYALKQAWLDLQAAGGGEIIIPQSPNGEPWLLDPTVFNFEGATAQSKVVIRGHGPGVELQPSGPMDGNWLTFGTTFTYVRNVLLSDPNEFVGGAAILTTKTARDNLPMRFERISGIGFGCFWANEVADNVGWTDLFTLNCTRTADVRSGGVGSFIDGLDAQGGREGVVLDGVKTPLAGGGYSTDHPEGFTIRRFEILPTQPGAVGIWARDILLLHMSEGVVGHLGPGGVGIFLDGTDPGAAVALVRASQVWAEAGTNGWCWRARGNVSDVDLDQCDVSYGGAASPVNGFDFQDAVRLKIDGGRTLDPGYSRFGQAAALVRCHGEVRGTTWDSGTITEALSLGIRWDTDWVPLAAGNGRSPLSSYPRADYAPYTPVLASALGTLGTATGTAFYLRDGKRIFVNGKVSIPDKGSAGGPLLVGMPVVPKAGREFQGSGRDNAAGSANAGKQMQVGVRNGYAAAIINVWDNSSPCTNGADIEFSITYEAEA